MKMARGRFSSCFSLVAAAHIVDNGSGMLCPGFAGLHEPPLCSVDCPNAGERSFSPLLSWRSVLGGCVDCVDSPSLWHLEPGHHFHEPCVPGSQCSLFEFCFRRFFHVSDTGGVPESPGVSPGDSAQGFRHRGIFRTPPSGVESCTMTAPMLSP